MVTGHIRPRVPFIVERFTVGVVGSLCRWFLRHGSRTVEPDTRVLLSLARHRPPNKPLITVVNHHSMLDDPLLWGVMPFSFLWDNRAMRFSIAAEEIIFTNPFFSAFFTIGKTIPVKRGLGIYQGGMNVAIEELNKGGWVNIYPEGKINTTPENILPFRWGVGHLMLSCNVPPIVMPVYHEGMDTVLPLPTKIPKFGKDIRVAYGDPVDYHEHIVLLRSKGLPEPVIRSKLTTMVRQQMQHLRDCARERWGLPPTAQPDPPAWEFRDSAIESSSGSSETKSQSASASPS